MTPEKHSVPADLLPKPNTPFGHPLRSLWSLDPGIHFLNHGSFGAAPRHVLAAQAHWREAMEREPVRFMVDELPQALRAARRWRRRLLDEHRIEVPIFPIAGRLWARISAQVYNELSDCEALARVFG